MPSGMSPARKIELLEDQIAAANGGHPSNFQQWKDKTEVVIRTVMGASHPLLEKFGNVRYTPSVWYSGMETRGYQPAGVMKVISLLHACIEEVNLAGEIEGAVETEREDPSATELAVQEGRVFVVHGHDNAAKLDTARLLRELTGVQPIILHEQPNGGQVLLEKFEAAAANTGFAVVLLTADDHGRAKDDVEGQPRARQNVIFEMGFFAGAIGRERLAVLYETGVELPSDTLGLAYLELDRAGAWKSQLARELASAGFEVDWSALGRV